MFEGNFTCVALMVGHRFVFGLSQKIYLQDYYRDLDAKADRLVEKVHEEGETSLTNEERRILEDYSRRMRQKHR